MRLVNALRDGVGISIATGGGVRLDVALSMSVYILTAIWMSLAVGYLWLATWASTITLHWRLRRTRSRESRGISLR